MKTAKKSTCIVLTTAQLRKLCDHAEELKFSHGPNAKFWKRVDPQGKHLVIFWMPHQPVLALWNGIDHGWNFAHNNGLNVRARLICKMKGTMEPQDLLCDFDWHDFMAIKEQQKKCA